MNPIGLAPSSPYHIVKPKLKLIMLKILYLNATAELSGTDISLLATVQTLDKKLFQPTILLPHPGPFDEQYRAIGIRVRYQNLGIIKRSHSRARQLLTLLTLPIVIFQLWRFIRREQFDLVYNNSLLLVAAGLAGRLAGKKVMWRSGELFTRPRLLKWLLYGLVSLLSHHIVVSSEAVRQLFPAWMRPRVTTMPIGIDLARFDPHAPGLTEAGRAIRQEFGIPEEALLVGFVGRFVPWKGVKEFALACAAAGQHSALAKAHFIAVGSLLVGYEAHFAEIERLAQQPELVGRFHLATDRQDIPAFLAAFDIFVHASVKPEPFGIVIIEAMAMGKPVIATAGGGVLEIIDQPQLGKLVECGNVEAMSEAIIELASDPAQRHALSRAARPTALARYDIDQATATQEQIYLQLLNAVSVGTGSPRPISAQPQPVIKNDATLDLSVIIVNYNGRGKILAALDALRQGLKEIKAEIFIVDNASPDSSLTEIKHWLYRLCPTERANYILLENQRNLGYARANNQALRQSRGKFSLLLNPDAEVEPDAIPLMLEFMRQHPRTGIAGPRILLPNGKLDAPCRRSFKTPTIYLYKFLGLSKLFPHSRRFGKYYLSYLDETETTEVDAVIGAFLLIRREVIDQIGPLDERYFMYCEDEDWCFQAKKRGWQVHYYPRAVVHHHKGASTSQRKFRMVWEWHKAVFKFHRKNLAVNYAPPVNLLVYAGITAQLTLTLSRNFFRLLKRR